MLWTDKYRPKTLDEVVGNNKEKALIQKWVDNWKAGNPQKPLLLDGPAGIGKTTLLKLLKEEIRPDGKMEGEIENRYGSMQTGYLFQNPEQQIVCRTVEEELVFGAENMDMPRDEMARSAAELAAYLGIEKMLHECFH